MNVTSTQLADADRLFREGKHADALRVYDRLIEMHPDFAPARFNRAVVLFHQGRIDDSAAEFRAALSRRPGWVEALLALGQLEFRRARHRDAEAWFQLACEAAPASAEAHCNLGMSQLLQTHPRRALPALMRARELAPAREEPWAGLRRALHMLRREREALSDFLRFERVAGPTAPVIVAALESAHLVPGDELERRYLPLALQWPYRATDLEPLSSVVGLLPYYDVTREAAFAVYQTYDRLAQLVRGNLADLALPPPVTDGRLRIGYLSADFRDHVMGRIMYEVIARHDASFEVFLYSLAPPGGEDALTDRLRQRSAGWASLSGLSDVDAAHRIADDRLHVLVELMGHTAWARPGILLFKPAPVIVSHLGYHGVVGLRQVDFKITDAIADVEDAGEFQVERPLRMGGSIVPIRTIAQARPPQRSLDAGFAFGAFVSMHKLSPRCLATWRQVIERAADAVLVFSPSHDWQQELYLRRVEGFGIDPGRVRFLARTHDEAQDRWRYASIDAMLDTFPYTGGDSAACAMAEGVPLVTLCGQRHPERVATSILTHLGITETIAASESEYVAIAVRLALDTPWRKAISDRIRNALPGHEAAMTAYVRSLEAALRDAWNLRPDPGRSRLAPA